MIERPPLRRVLIALASLAIVILCLHWSARFDLRGPGGFSRDELDIWSEDSTRVVTTVLRWIALGFSYYLFVIVALVGFTADRYVPTRLAGTIGALLGAAAIAVPLAGHMVATPGPTATEAEPALQLAIVEEPLTLTELRSNHTVAHPHQDLTPPAKAADTVRVETWAVVQGDHLWSIAQETLEDVWSRNDLTDAEIVPYWRAVIDANADRLVEPGNPDLILPGQILVLPEPPADDVR